MVPSIEALNTVAIEFGRERVLVFRHLMATEPKEREEAEKTIQETRARIEKAFKDYEPLVANDEDRRLLDAERKAFDEYRKGVDGLLALSRAQLDRGGQAGAQATRPQGGRLQRAAQRPHALQQGAR